MRFPHPVAVACLNCGQPTVEAETSTGFVRVHCGTWRWQCDTPAGAEDSELTDSELTLADRTTRGPASDPLAA